MIGLSRTMRSCVSFWARLEGLFLADGTGFAGSNTAFANDKGICTLIVATLSL